MKNNARPRSLHLFISCAVLLTTWMTSHVTAQTIVIDCANMASGSYAAGSNIGVPITTTGSFRETNTYELYLSDATGSFASETKIGTFSGVYAGMINGMLPTGLNGNYKIRLKSTSPALVSQSCDISVKAGTVSASATCTETMQEYFGSCSGNYAGKTLRITNTSTTGATVVGTLINNHTGVATVATLTSNYWNITLPDATDYTFIVTATKDGVISTKSYTIINNSFSLNLYTPGDASGCIPLTTSVTIPTTGLANNYPGVYYKVSWGDNLPNSIEIYTVEDLLNSSGKVSHTYEETSCGLANNSFQQQITFVYPFTSSTCNNTNISTNITVFRKPEANFTFTNPACIKKQPVTFTNTSVIGNGNVTSVCSALAYFTWYVDGVIVYDSPTPEGTAPNLVYTFPTTGKYKVTLEVRNTPCGISSLTQEICIEDEPDPSFTISLNPSNGCIPAGSSLIVSTDTLLNKTKYYCQPYYTESWSLLKKASSGAYANAVLGTDYTVIGSTSGPEPKFSILKPGTYKVVYTVSNSCGPYSSEKEFTAYQATVTMPAAVTYCDLQSVKFSSTAHKPTYSNSTGTVSYHWDVTGGSFEYEASTTASSQYPQIKFKDYGVYTVTITYTNLCGTKSSSQTITFIEPVKANVIQPAADTAVCYNIADINLRATTSGGSVGSLAWTYDAASNGKFSSTNTLNTNYTFGANEKSNGSVILYLTVKNADNHCKDTTIQRKITIYPENKGNPASKSICSGGKLNYQPGSTVLTSTFTWTAAVTQGSATGYNDQTVPTAAPIQDILKNSSTSVIATVEYTITPHANDCTGDSYKLVVTVNPTPALSVDAPATPICSGDKANIILKSSVANTTYTWTSVAPSGITGNTSQSTTDATNIVTIDDELTNNGTSTGTVTYKITATSPSGCDSDPQTITVNVRPRVTTAKAGSDQKLCNATQTTLSGNNPVTGTGSWTQIGSPAVTITNPSLYNTTITGLQPEQEYTFKWTITNNDGCPDSEDEVVIYNRPEIEAPDAGDDKVYCTFLSTATNYVTLNATPVTRTYEEGTWTVINQPALSNYNFTNTHAAGTSFYFSKPGTYTLRWTIAGDATCTPKYDEVTLEVYETPAVGVVVTTTPNVCAGSDVTVSLQSYTGAIDKWEYNPDPVNSTSWYTATGTGSSITFNNVQDTFDVRVTVISTGAGKSCLATITALPVRVYVSAQSIGGNTDADATVCKGYHVGYISLSNYLGTITGWQSSVDNGATWTNIGYANTEKITYSNLTKTTWYRAVVKNGSCNEVYSDITKITVADRVSLANAGTDQTLCNVSSTTLNANSPATGETGEWTQIDGPGNATMSSTNNPTITVSGLISGIYTFTWTLSNGICPVEQSNVTVTISASASGGSVSADKTFCKGSDNGVLTLNSYFGTISKWQSSTDGGTTWVDIANTLPSLRYSNLPQTTMFRAVITNGYCTVPAYSTPATITIKNAVTQADAGSNQQLCNTYTTQLQANAVATGETGTWSQLSGPNTAGMSSTNDPHVQLTGLVQGTYKFKWTIDNGGTCPSTESEVEVAIYPPLTNKIDVTPVTLCEGQLVTISNTEVSGGKGKGSYSYQWQYSTDGQATWNDFGLNATAADFSFIATETMYVRRKVSSGPCTEYSDPVLVTVQAALSNNTITDNETLCINTSAATITGSLPAGGDGVYLYVWEQSTDNGNTWSVIPGANTQDYYPGTLTATTLYRRKISTALCNGLQTSTSNIITKTVNPDAKAQFTALSTFKCAPFVINNSNIATTTYNDRNASYTWKADEQIIGNISDFPSYTIANADDSVTIKLVVASAYGCKSDSMELKFYAAAEIDPSFTVSSNNDCGPLTVTFTNTSVLNNKVSYNWDFGNGQTSTSFEPPAVTYEINAGRKDTTYTARLTIVTPCTTKDFELPITVRAKPKATFTPSKTTGCSPFTVLFTNNSLGERITYTWNFDDASKDSVTTSAGQIEHTFITYVQDTFHMRLIAANECGADTLIYNIVVSPNTVRLNMAINGNERIGCAPLTVKFNNNSRGATGFQWNFGDGNKLNTTEGIETITHEFTQPGKYTITLVATNGCSDTTGYEYVEILALPQVDFTPLPAEVCIGDSILFRNDSEPLTGMKWNFGDGNTSTSTSPKHAYTAANTYSVTLEGSLQYATGNICTTTVTKSVKVVPSMPGDFTVSDQTGNCVPFTITFTNITQPSVLTKWDFGDGETATGEVVSHTFRSNGNFIVSMQALHPQGCTYVASKTITIQGPEGQWVYDYGYICKDKPVRFEVSAVRTTSYKWAFGDGDTLVTTDNIVYHVYKQSGTYTPSVQLLSTDCGVWLHGQEQIKVDYYKAGFSFVQQKNCGNNLIAFQDTSRTTFGISRREWNFGDGTISGGEAPQHAFAGTNSWQVQLIIYNVSGCSDTVTAPVYTRPNMSPTAAISSKTSGCVGQPVTYTAVVNSEDPVTLYKWSFSNGYTSNGEQVTNTYVAAGVFQAQLIAGTQYGCYDTISIPTVVNPAPVVNAGNDVTICLGQSAQLNASGATSMIWIPTDGLSCSNCTSPLASPTDTRQYVVSGTNSYGCVSSDSMIVNIIPPSKIEVSQADTLCVGQSVQLNAWGNSRYTWSPTATLSAFTISNPIASPKVTTTYRVIGTDDKSCFRDTAYITVSVGQWPVVNLGQDRVLSTGTQIPLTPSVTNGPIRKWSWTPVKDLSCADCALPIVTVKKDACYTVTVQNTFNCEASDTICIKAFCENTQVFIPNAFVPGATSNNILTVRGKGIKLVKSFRIFNRWGQVVFDKANFPPNEKSFGWDGNINGVPATPDVYVYTCEVVCEDDKAYTYKGNVAILK